MWIMAQNGSLINFDKYDCVKVIEDRESNKFRVVICRGNEIEFIGEYLTKDNAQSAVYGLTDELEGEETIFDMPVDPPACFKPCTHPDIRLDVKDISMIYGNSVNNDDIEIVYKKGNRQRETYQGVKSIILEFDEEN